MNKLIFVFGIFTVLFYDYCESREIGRSPAKFNEGVREEIVAAIQRCNIGEKLPEMVRLIREGSYGDDDFFKNFIHCGFKESGYIHENGRIDIEKASKAFAEHTDDLVKVMKQCDKPLDDPATTTFEYFKCFQDNTPYVMHLY